MNIAPIEDDRPMLGIVPAPAKRHAVAAVQPGWAPTSEAGGAFTAIAVRSPRTPTDRLRQPAAIRLQSARHLVYKQGPHRHRSNPGRLVASKFCLIAEGKADIYHASVRPTEMGQQPVGAMSKAAGGESSRPPMAGRFAYGKPRFSNLHFIARSKAFR